MFLIIVFSSLLLTDVGKSRADIRHWTAIEPLWVEAKLGLFWVRLGLFWVRFGILLALIGFNWVRLALFWVRFSHVDQVSFLYNLLYYNALRST